MDPQAISQELVDRLEGAWNAADGEAYGAPFTSDADFVAIRGDHHRSAGAIAAGHQHIFDTIYAGSTIRYQLVQARQLDDRVIVAHVESTLNAPTGPLAGEHSAIATSVLFHGEDGWRIAAFHNTLMAG